MNDSLCVPIGGFENTPCRDRFPTVRSGNRPYKDKYHARMALLMVLSTTRLRSPKSAK